MSTRLTTAEAATALGLSERQVENLAARDQIPGAYKEGRDWRFPEKPRVIRPKRGRPVMSAGRGAES